MVGAIAPPPLPTPNLKKKDPYYGVLKQVIWLIKKNFVTKTTHEMTL